MSNPSTPRLDLGASIQGEHADYRISSVLSDGNTTAYKATVTRLKADRPRLETGIDVVVKMPKPSAVVGDFFRPYDSEIADRIKNEDKALQELQDLDCVAHALDTGESHHYFGPRVAQRVTLPFLVQEFIDGDTFAELLTQRYQVGGVFSGVPSALDFFDWSHKLTTALLNVHRHLVVHGDLSAGNIMVNRTDSIVLIDLGHATYRGLTTHTMPPGRPTEAIFRPPEKKLSVQLRYLFTRWSLALSRDGQWPHPFYDVTRSRCYCQTSAVRGKSRHRTVSLDRSMSYGLFCPGTI